MENSLAMFVEPYPRWCAGRERVTKVILSIDSIEKDPFVRGVK
jgi:hypothetical protein